MSLNKNDQYSDLVIATFNVRGLHGFTKRKDVFHFLRNEKAEIICLQELHIAPGEESIFRNQWGGRAWFSPLSSTKGGVGILMQNHTDCRIINVLTNSNGCVISLHIEINGAKLFIVNIYGPPDKDDPEFFSEVFDLMYNDSHENVIFCGDWNLTLEPYIDTYNYSSRDRRLRSRSLIKQKCSDLNMHDVWRTTNGNTKQFSWRKNNPVKCARLDFFLVTESLLNKTVSCKILPAYRSDHSRVLLTLNMSNSARGRGFWKFNCSLLEDLTYSALVKKTIEKTVHGYACPVYNLTYLSSQECRDVVQMTINDALFLETLLMKIRSETVEYSIKKKKERTEKQKLILQDIHTLESLSAPSENDIRNIAAKQSDLQSVREAENIGRIIRSRARWYEEGEKSTRYFLNLEKRNFDSKLIPSLKIGEKELRSNNDILNALSEHFSKVFKTPDDYSQIDALDYLDNTICPSLTEAESQSLELDITAKSN